MPVFEGHWPVYLCTIFGLGIRCFMILASKSKLKVFSLLFSDIDSVEFIFLFLFPDVPYILYHFHCFNN